MKSLDNKKTGFRKMTADDLRRGIDLSKSISGFKVIETKSNKKKPKELPMIHKQYSVLSNKKSETQTKELEWDRFVKENHTDFSRDANGIKYEFYEDDLLSFISSLLLKQKQQILNLECLKEESERFGDEFSYIRGQSVGRNQLRKEIKEEINKL